MAEEYTEKTLIPLEWHCDKRTVNQLIPYKTNPRILTEKQAKNLRESLEKFNLVEIPAIDADNKLIAGHQRCKLLQLLGRGEDLIDVRMPNRQLTEREYREYLIRSNKNSGGWDFEELANSWDEAD